MEPTLKLNKNVMTYSTVSNLMKGYHSELKMNDALAGLVFGSYDETEDEQFVKSNTGQVKVVNNQPVLETQPVAEESKGFLFTEPLE